MRPLLGADDVARIKQHKFGSATQCWQQLQQRGEDDHQYGRGDVGPLALRPCATRKCTTGHDWQWY
eukprot:COSAG01_NODE_5965_length_3929_cov_4.932898_3_plen_66_part_00